MPVTKKNKVLGQYFSGDIVARLLCSLVDIHQEMSVIDPMAGIGDMFIPLNGYSKNLHAVEIDPDAYSSLRKVLPSAKLGNAFSKEIMASYHTDGYDLVITNPPYVRRELLQASQDLPYYLSAKQIYSNIRDFVSGTKTLNKTERRLFLNHLGSISGLSDLAIPSWLLCMLLTKPGGQLALVVPSAWMNREYAKPVASLLNDLFEIEYIFKDSNSVLFKGKALVQTNLIVARRRVQQKKEERDNNIFIISAFDSFIKRPSFIQNLHTLLGTSSSLPNECEIKVLPQSSFNLDSPSSINGLSVLGDIVELNTSTLTTLEDLGVVCNQGFRSGANSFFYFVQEQNQLVSGFRDILPLKYQQVFFTPAIQNQEDLNGSFSVGPDTSHFLLTINNYATAEDSASFPGFTVLPDEVSDYIRVSESRAVKGIRIPELSAVRTNVRPAKNGILPRFWYMLPAFTARHRPVLFMPRVNSNRTYAYLNEYNYVVDANFITFSLKNNSAITYYGLLALLNSTWSAIQFEEQCSVLGGGALKIDSIQLSKMFFPSFSKQDLFQLNQLGKELAKTTIDASLSIINKIDSIILSVASGRNCLSTDQLRSINSLFIERRHGSK